MRVITRGAAVFAVLLWAGVHTSLAQQTAQASQSYIMGFQLVPWGSDTTSIYAAYGKPMLARASGDSGMVLIYREAGIGKSIFSLFYLDKEQGLVRGVSSVPYGEGNDCEAVMTRARESNLRIYSALTPVEERVQDDPSAPFCEAAAAGKAHWKITWQDPSSHNSITIELEPEQARVEIVYLSDAYQPPPKS